VPDVSDGVGAVGGGSSKTLRQYRTPYTFESAREVTDAPPSSFGDPPRQLGFYAGDCRRRFSANLAGNLLTERRRHWALPMSAGQGQLCGKVELRLDGNGRIDRGRCCLFGRSPGGWLLPILAGRGAMIVERRQRFAERSSGPFLTVSMSAPPGRGMPSPSRGAACATSPPAA